MDTKMKQFPTNISNPVLSVGMDGTVLYSNEAGEPLLHEWGVRVGEKLPSSIGYIAQRVISRNNPEKIEVKVGKSVYLIVFHPLSMQECVNISGFDISGQKEFEEKPLESKEKYQDLFNLIEQAVQIGEIVFDENGRSIDNIILDVNLAYEKHSGLRREQVIGRGFKEIFPIVEQRWLDRYGEVVRTGMGMHFEEYNASLDRWFEVFASPMGSNRFIAVFSDITRHKQTEEDLLRSEQHYRLLHETMLQGVVYQDASGKIISMNPAAERILGKTPAEFLGSSSVGEEYLTIREDGSMFPGLEHPAMVSLRTGQKVQGVVMGVYNPRENFYRWININAVPIFRTGEDRPFQVYTLFDDITERKQEEHRIRRYNRILKGINRIFSNVVQAKTEEEVGNACLSVALEVTGSEFGFINEMGTDGLLHDVAKSDLGWERCFMYDKTGHRRPPSFFAVHGLYGSVIINEKGFFTSDPPSHPDSIGIPYGHPPLTSFLGVPLVQDGKTIGLIAVANREGGYSSEQQEDLEAIAPAVVQALQRKKAEEALRLSNIYNRSLIESSLDPLVTIGRDGKITDVNCATEQVTGYSRNDLIKTDFSDYFTEPENARAGYKQVFTDGEVRDYPLEIQHKDGHITPVLYNASVYRDENGEVIGVFAAARDITERKRAEHQLSNELARATGLYELYTRSSNLSDRELYDFALNQAVKITDSTIGFFHLVSEDEKEIILTTWNQEALRSCTAGNEGHYPIEKAGNWVDCVRLKRPVVYNDFPSSPNQKGLPAGHATVNRFMSVPVTENGKVRVIFGVGNKVDEYDDRDVMQLQLVANELHKIMKLRRIENEVRESEAFLRDIMENVSDAIFVKDREARMILANTAFYRLMGKPPEEVLGKTVADFHPPEIARKLAEDDKRVMEAGKGTTLEERIFTSYGWRILQTVKAPYYDGQGNIIGLIGAARDITERKKAEEALKKAYDNLDKLVKERTAELEKAYTSLKESEKGLAEAQKMAHIGNWDLDLVTGEVFWSDELYQIFGRNPQESGATYHELLNYIHPDDRDFVDSAIKKGLNEKPSGIDYRVLLANGEERNVHAESEVIFDENDVPVRAKGIVQDITERKKSEEKIRNLANIVESSSDAIGTISLEGVITSWNKGAEQVYGYSAEEILGKTESILTLPHLSEETKKLTDRVIKGERINNYETSRLRKDGTIINVSLTLSPVFDASGKLTAVSVIARDITERKRVEEKLREIEEKYRNIVETANEGILIIDDEAIITYANKKMADMLGYTLEEGLGRPVWDFADEESKTILKQSLEKRRQGINGSYELKLICKDGSSLWALINAKSIFDKDGKFMGTVSMLTDITKRKKAEEALERMDKARIKEIHHRIKNNLQIISSLLDLQAEKFEDENVIESFREGQNRVISMSLIHEELYKGEGTDTLDFSAYFKKLAENLFKTYNLSSKNISLSMDLEEDTFFDMDTAVPLGIIVNELVSNSLKHAFNEDEEGKIRIKLCREEKNSEMGMSLFSLTDSDDGKGLPDDMELKCVESLGLQLVNILVDQLDGELQLKREQGTEFTIKFKVIEKDNPAHAGLKSQKNG